jgi:hypothetical protein
VLEGPAEPVELGDHQLVALPVRRQQRLVQLRAAGEIAGCRVDDDRVAVGGGEGVVLGLGRPRQDSGTRRPHSRCGIGFPHTLQMLRAERAHHFE